MDVKEFRAKLKSGEISGVYVFAGEEDYLKRYYLSELREQCAIEPSFEPFNHCVYDGEKVDFGKVLEDVKSPPMMSDFKIIEWGHANFNLLTEKELEQFIDLCREAQDYSYAVVAFLLTTDGLDLFSKKKAKIKETLQKESNLLIFNKSTDAQLLSWLKRHFEALGVSAGADALNMLLFMSGKNMDALEKEVKKISYMVLERGRNEATAEDVREAASSTPESDAFALSNALSERNIEAAYAAIQKMKNDRVDPIVVTGAIAKVYTELLTVARMMAEGMDADDLAKKCKLNPKRIPHLIKAVKRYGREKLSEIMGELARMDVSSKYGGISGYTAIELFVGRML